MIIFRRSIIIKYVKPVLLSLGLFLFVASGYYFFIVHKINKAYNILYEVKGEIGLRKFPYPYRAALSIASDIDKTDTLEEFIEIQQFLNTTNTTGMGQGVGLEIGNTFFMFPSNNEFSYFSNRPSDRVTILNFAESGFIDSIHSWGNGFQDRNSAVIALEEYTKNRVKFEVWINHAQSPSNFGNWKSGYGHGDNRDSKYYHADLTISHGVKYVWLGSSTWIIGQATPIRLSTFIGSYDSRHPIKSLFNVSKAFSKHLLSIFGLEKNRYALHASNDLVRPVILDDGQRVYQFTRYDNHFMGIGKGAFAKTMHYNLSERVIQQLKKAKGYAILYTHFGINSDCEQAITKETQGALRFLAKEYQNGEVYVTTTSKLLRYYIYHKFLNWSYQEDSGVVIITINSVDDPIFGTCLPSIEDLQGITFYVPANKKVRLFIANKEIDAFIKNPIDENNRESITIPLTHLKYPEFSINN